MTTKAAISEETFEKAIAEFEAAHTLNTGATAPRVTRKGNLAFIGNDATGISLADLREMTVKLRKGL